MDDVAAHPGRKPGKMSLLAPHPGDTVARVHRHDLHWDDIAPRPATQLSGFAIDERREPQAAQCRELGDQLPGEDLHPSGLAGHEVYEVEAHVHDRPG